MAKRKIIKPATNIGIPLENLLENFLMEKKATGSVEATLRCYRGSFKKFNTYLGEMNTTDDINEITIWGWVTDMQDSGIKPASINHYITDMRVFLYWCMKNDYIPEFKISLIRAQEEVKETYSQEQLEVLLEKPAKYDSFVTWRCWAIINWLMATGNRAATICDIQMEDINFLRKEIILGHTKNKRAQILPLSAALETALKEYIRMWRSDAAPKQYLFCSIGDEKLTYNALRQAIEKYNNDRGVPITSIHSFRHTFAKEYILRTGDMARLQKILGHSTLDMTKRYANMFDRDLKENFNDDNPLDNIKKAQSRKNKIKQMY